MCKRIIIYILLLMSIVFCSCSSQHNISNYEIQSESTKRMMKENEKIRKKNTPIRKKKSFFLFNFKSKGNYVDQNMLNDGVNDTRQ